MTSNSSLPNLEKLVPSPRTTYDLLLGDKELWNRVLGLFRSREWAALKALMEAERQEHLEAMVSSSDGAEQQMHLIIARWLKQFFDRDGRQAELISEHTQAEAPPAPALEGSEFMSPDSDSIITDGAEG